MNVLEHVQNMKVIAVIAYIMAVNQLFPQYPLQKVKRQENAASESMSENLEQHPYHLLQSAGP